MTRKAVEVKRRPKKPINLRKLIKSKKKVATNMLNFIKLSGKTDKFENV